MEIHNELILIQLYTIAFLFMESWVHLTSPFVPSFAFEWHVIDNLAMEVTRRGRGLCYLKKSLMILY